MATENNSTQFRKSHPIDFTLFDDDEQAVMYISEDISDRKLHLTIANTSTQDMSMMAGPTEVSASNYHFALQFRPGTLSRRTLELLASPAANKVVSTPDWKLAQHVHQAGTNAPVRLYFLYTGSKSTLSIGETRSIVLSGLSAAPGSGARGTQVELIPHQLQLPGNTAITGSRTQYMHVTNHSGRKNIPLHMSIIEGSRVQNGAMAATLTLRLTNICKAKDVSTSTIVFSKGEDNYPATKLVLSCDTGTDDWDLGSITGVGVPVGLVSAAGPRIGETPSWDITFPNNNYSLEYGKSLDLAITIDVSAKTGNANLYLHYDNIPGYWDGQFVCSIEKGPVVIKDGNVGIGGAPLEIEDANKQKSPMKLGVTGPVKMAFGDSGSLAFLGNGPAYPTMMVQGNEFQVCSGNSGNYGGNIQKMALRTEELSVPGNIVCAKDIEGNKLSAKMLEVNGDVKMDFGAGSGLRLQANTNNNTGIFVGLQQADGTHQPNNGLTIADVYVNKNGERALLNAISLNAQTVMAAGDIEVAGAIKGKGDSGAVIIKGTKQFVGSRKLAQEKEYLNKCISILDMGIYGLGGPPPQTGATRKYRFYIVAWDSWNYKHGSGDGTLVQIIPDTGKSIEVHIPAIWGSTEDKHKGHAYSELFEFPQPAEPPKPIKSPKLNWIKEINIRSITGNAATAAYLYELWVEYFDVF
ncbi:hypothetical protein [Undibacterium sp. TS12]|uniref:hypothetical protein n=1 Tax=Undibacterium sp. TS12 TaxID=2908202 RepID=UPI001F4CA6E1|nr:hypothetical protein [Undibacterium sp. TS12]MCH8619360.1 hypothetical protein [Undibacterium sp. TS12]